jgi:hypothetical protein
MDISSIISLSLKTNFQDVDQNISHVQCMASKCPSLEISSILSPSLKINFKIKSIFKDEPKHKLSLESNFHAQMTLLLAVSSNVFLVTVFVRPAVPETNFLF